MNRLQIKFKIPLTTTSNKQQGEVNMEGILWVVPIENPRIKLSLDEISAIDLHDTGNFLDTQDPLLYLKVGKFNFKTDRVKDGGTKCSFKEIYNDLDLYYKVAGAGLWGALAFVFSIIISYIIQKIIVNSNLI
jgi:hypothetical protein